MFKKQNHACITVQKTSAVDQRVERYLKYNRLCRILHCHDVQCLLQLYYITRPANFYACCTGALWFNITVRYYWVTPEIYGQSMLTWNDWCRHFKCFCINWQHLEALFSGVWLDLPGALTFCPEELWWRNDTTLALIEQLHLAGVPLKQFSLSKMAWKRKKGLKKKFSSW